MISQSVATAIHWAFRSPPQEVTSANLLAWYFAQNQSAAAAVSGSVVTDFSSAGNNAAMVNSHCGTFDGVNDYISIQNHLGTTGAFKISFYIKPSNIELFNATWGAGVIKSTNNAPLIGDFIVSINSDGTLSFYNWRNAGVDADGRQYSTTALLNGQTYFIECEWDGTENKIYIDGIEETLGTPTTTNTSWGTSNLIGSDFLGSPTYFCAGDLYGVRIEHAGALVFDMPLSEGDGKTIYDVSGNENHGTAVNTTDANFWANTQDVFHYNIRNGFSEGVNYLPYSTDFDETPDWILQGVTLVMGTTDPFGGSNAAKITETTDNSQHRIYQNTPIAASADKNTASVYAKAGERTKCALRTFIDGFKEVIFDLSSGTIVSEASATGSITDVGSGWYRITATATGNDIDPSFWRFNIADDSNATTYVGDITKGMFIFGAQFEESDAVTSYQPTTGSSNVGAKVPADINGYLPNGLNDAVSNPPGAYHNAAETDLNLNPTGNAALIAAGVPLNETLAYGDDLSAKTYTAYKKKSTNKEYDFLIYDSALSASDAEFLALAGWVQS